jgi:hypothetical protein
VKALTGQVIFKGKGGQRTKTVAKEEEARARSTHADENISLTETSVGERECGLGTVSLGVFIRGQ